MCITGNPLSDAKGKKKKSNTLTQPGKYNPLHTRFQDK